MTLFREKNRIVEAEQWDGEFTSQIQTIPEKYKEYLPVKTRNCTGYYISGEGKGTFVAKGDWIVKYKNNFVDICPDKAFWACFEPVEGYSA